LINQAAKAPLQFPKNRKVIFQLGSASRVGLTILDLREERHHCPSRLGNAGSKSSQFGFRF
jgi:hypothetical protein